MSSAHLSNSEEVIVPGEQYLHVRVLRGRAFGSADSDESEASYVLHVSFGSQRFSSEAVPCRSEPEFDEGFLIKMGNEVASIDSAKKLLSGAATSIPLQFALVRVEGGIDGARELIASHELEWRRVLGRGGGANVSIEMSGPGPTSKSRLTVGIIDIHISMLPALDARYAMGVTHVNEVLNREAAGESDAHRRFCKYARVWWQEYTDIREDFRTRP